MYSNSQSLSNLTPDQIFVYVENKTLSDAGRRSLQQIIDAKKQIAALDAQAKSVDTSIASVTRDEERNRQNIASLNTVSGQQQQVQTYATKLAEQENQLAKLRDQQSDLQNKRAAAQSTLDALMDRIEF